MMFSDVMTVYNYRRDVDTEVETWQRTIIKGIQWQHNKSEVSTSGGVQTENKVESITIDCDRTYGNKQYLPPNEYQKRSAEECAAYWTLDAKTAKDVLVMGVSEKEISRGYKIAELGNDFQYTATVTAVSDNRNKPFLKHIKVVAK